MIGWNWVWVQDQVRMLHLNGFVRGRSLRKTKVYCEELDQGLEDAHEFQRERDEEALEALHYGDQHGVQKAWSKATDLPLVVKQWDPGSIDWTKVYEQQPRQERRARARGTTPLG